MNSKKISTPDFHFSLIENGKLKKLNRPNQLAYRIKFLVGSQKFDIDVTVHDADHTSAHELTQTKFAANRQSGFSNENIPPFQYPKQDADLVAWGCRYRWADGGSAPYRFQDAYVEINDKIIHLSYSAEPENFDPGVVVFNEIVKSIRPLNIS